MQQEKILADIRKKLEFIYNDARADVAYDGIRSLINHYHKLVPKNLKSGWDQTDTFLITYGDSIRKEGEKPLQTLNRFLKEYGENRISFVHLLPFFPFTSDDGFAVTDFRQVDPELGDWDDIKALSKQFRVVFDAVINHVSESSVYMEGYRNGDPDYRDFFIALDKDTDTSSVLRTRNLPLLHDYQTHEGIKWLWTTFSRDQLDLNFANPKVLLEIIDILLLFVQHGASMIRLDAIPYLWKKLGTSCAHLPETHEIIRLIRDVYDAVCPDALLLTETNVPHKENISYFGNKGDEAQMIYNFSLPPLILHAIISEDSQYLTAWASDIEKICDHATYLNITATHDGIGVRPTEGILPEEERQKLVKLAYDHNGDVTGKRNSDGSVSPYELNLNYFDAVNDPNSDESIELQIKRFMLSQAIPACFIGLPGIYIHSLLGSRNYYEGVKETGRARSINREKLDYDELVSELRNCDSLRARIFDQYKSLLTLRSQQSAFHPNAEQQVLDLGNRCFALQRHNQETNETIIAVFNISSAEFELNLEKYINVPECRELVTNQQIDPRSLALAPYQFVLLKR